MILVNKNITVFKVSATGSGKRTNIFQFIILGNLVSSKICLHNVDYRSLQLMKLKKCFPFTTAITSILNLNCSVLRQVGH